MGNSVLLWDLKTAAESTGPSILETRLNFLTLSRCAVMVSLRFINRAKLLLLLLLLSPMQLNKVHTHTPQGIPVSLNSPYSCVTTALCVCDDATATRPPFL